MGSCVCFWVCVPPDSDTQETKIHMELVYLGLILGPFYLELVYLGLIRSTWDLILRNLQGSVETEKGKGGSY